MTIKELKKILDQYPKDMVVKVAVDEEWNSIGQLEYAESDGELIIFPVNPEQTY